MASMEESSSWLSDRNSSTSQDQMQYSAFTSPYLGRPGAPSKTPFFSHRVHVPSGAASVPTTRSPVNGSPGSSLSFLDSGQFLGTMQAAADDRSLPPTPRSPSPTCSPPSSPKRQRNEEARSTRYKDAQPSTKNEAQGHASDSGVDDDLEVRAAALGLNETTQRVWRETNLPPTPSSPSPTFSPPSSPKQGRQACALHTPFYVACTHGIRFHEA